MIPLIFKTDIKILISLLLSILLTMSSCKEKSEWIVLFGEMNDDLALAEFQGNYHYYNIEYFFIDTKTNKAYHSIDTNDFIKAKALIPQKLKALNAQTLDEKAFQITMCTKESDKKYQLEFKDDQGRQMLYKINVSDTLNDNVYVFSKYKDKYIECQWPGRKGRMCKTKKMWLMAATTPD